MSVDYTKWRLAGGTDRYMLGCSNFREKLHFLGGSRRSGREVGAISCSMVTHRNLGHPRIGCENWSPDPDSVLCLSCRLLLTRQLVRQKQISSKTKGTNGEYHLTCPRCGCRLTAEVSDTVLLIRKG